MDLEMEGIDPTNQIELTDEVAGHLEQPDPTPNQPTLARRNRCRGTQPSSLEDWRWLEMHWHK